MSTTKSSSGYRALEILLGIVALAVGILALIFPEGFIVTLVVLFAISLLVIGVLRLATAVSSSLPSSMRGANAAIGVLAILIGAVILFYPGLATATIIILLGVGLLIYAVGRIVVGGTAGNLSGGLKALLILTGILIAIFSLIVIFFPIVGVITWAILLSIIFILIGIESIASGISGKPLT